MATERVAPDAILVQTNLTGLVTVIQDDPDAPDLLWLTATNANTQSELRVSFPTATSGVPSGTQEARSLVRKVGGANALSVTVEVYDGAGALLASSPATTVGGDVVIPVSFAATTDPEVRVLMAAQGGKASSKSTFEVGAVEWNAVTVVPAAPSVSGGSEATVTATADGGGSATHSGGAEATVTVTAEGGGTVAPSGPISGGSEVTVTAAATGAGTKVTSAGSAATTTLTTAGGGAKTARGGVEASVTIVAEGASEIVVDVTGLLGRSPTRRPRERLTRL